MPAAKLAEFIDTLVAQHGVRVTESPEHVILSGVPTSHVVECANRVLEPLSLDDVTDAAGQTHSIEDLDESFGPYRIRIGKNEPNQTVFRIVSNSAFERLLRQDFQQDTVKVARLEMPIITMGIQFLPWDAEPKQFEREDVSNPLMFLTDLRPDGRVSDKLGNWILRNPTEWREGCEASKVWRWAATKRLIPALSVQVSHDGETLSFGTSPRVSLNASRLLSNEPLEVEQKAFISLQEAAHWVFEEPKQTGMRHGLFNAEVARIAHFNQDVVELINENCSIILETSHIAYRLGLSELSGNALQLLSQLRSEVFDQIVKSTDSTRQLALALAGALSLGIGLVAAKLSSAAPESVLITALVVASSYVVLVGYVGFQYVNSLRSSRKAWRDHLYHFLPEATYTQMVVRPIGNAFRDYIGACMISGVSLLAVWCALIVSQPSDEEIDIIPSHADSEMSFGQSNGEENKDGHEQLHSPVNSPSAQDTTTAFEIQNHEDSQSGNEIPDS